MWLYISFFILSPCPHLKLNERKSMLSGRQKMLTEIDREVLREFKADAIRRGKTIREEVERLMREHLEKRRKNGGKTST